MAAKIKYNYYVLMELPKYNLNNMAHIICCGRTSLPKDVIEKKNPNITVFFVSFEAYRIFKDFLA